MKRIIAIVKALGRSRELRIFFRIAQVTTLVFAVAVLAENCAGTGLAGQQIRPDISMLTPVIDKPFESSGPLGEPWTTTGGWVVTPGNLTYVTKTEGTAVAGPERQVPSRMVLTTTMTVGSGAGGLIFGYHSPTDYFRVIYSGPLAALAIEQVKGTSVDRIASVGPVGTPSEMGLTMEFTTMGVTVYLNDQAVYTTQRADFSLGSSQRVGLYGLSGPVTFTKFYYGQAD